MYDDNLKLIPHKQILVTQDEWVKIMYERHKRKKIHIEGLNDYTPSDEELLDASWAKGD